MREFQNKPAVPPLSKLNDKPLQKDGGQYNGFIVQVPGLNELTPG
jgi:hypothetical protein